MILLEKLLRQCFELIMIIFFASEKAFLFVVEKLPLKEKSNSNTASDSSEGNMLPEHKSLSKSVVSVWE